MLPFLNARFIVLASLILLATLMPTAIFVKADIDHNSQEESCEYTAYETNKPTKPDITFVKIYSGYIPYSPDLHSGLSKYYIQYEGKNIHESNWSSNGDPCILTEATYVLFWTVWLLLIAALSFPLALFQMLILLKRNRRE